MINGLSKLAWMIIHQHLLVYDNFGNEINKDK
jgi:hypothetical protein